MALAIHVTRLSIMESAFRVVQKHEKKGGGGGVSRAACFCVAWKSRALLFLGPQPAKWGRRSTKHFSMLFCSDKLPPSSGKGFRHLQDPEGDFV